jgi:homeobox protein TGIF1
MNSLNKLLAVENEYLYKNMTRENLLVYIRQLRLEHERRASQVQDGNSKYLKIATYLVLEKVKQTILLENKLVEIIDSESFFVSEHMRRLLFETMRINMGSAPRRGSVSYRPPPYLSGGRSIRPRTRANFPLDISKLLRNWLKENMDNPYPSDNEKAFLCQQTGLGPAQINNWFINARRRILPFMKDKFMNYQ